MIQKLKTIRTVLGLCAIMLTANTQLQAISLNANNEKVSKTLFILLENITEDKGEAHITYYKKRIDECIMKGADPNYQEDLTCLMLLCRTTFKPFRKSQKEWLSNAMLRVALIEHLMDKKGTDANKPDDCGNTAVHYAVRGGAPIILSTLLQYTKVDINRKNDNGETALMELISQLGARLWIDKDDVLKCLNLLTEDPSRLKLDKTNHEGKTSADLMADFCEKRLPKIKKWFPELPETMSDIRQKLELN
jgi:hypothetical protein